MSDPVAIKDVLTRTDGSFDRARFNPLVEIFFGRGLIGLLVGDTWTFHRKIANKAFRTEQVKVLNLYICTIKEKKKKENLVCLLRVNK